MASQQTMSGMIGELTGQPFVLPVMLTGHIRSFPSCSVVISMQRVAVDLKSNAIRTVVYNPRIETGIGVHALPVTKLKLFSLLLVNLLVSLF